MGALQGPPQMLYTLLCLSLNSFCALHGNGSQNNLFDVIYSNLERMVVQRPKKNGFSLTNAKGFCFVFKAQTNPLGSLAGYIIA